jgi:hypothetical protein
VNYSKSIQTQNLCCHFSGASTMQNASAGRQAFGLKELVSVDACTTLSSPTVRCIHTYPAWLAKRPHPGYHALALVVLMPHFSVRRDCHNAWPDFSARSNCHVFIFSWSACIAAQQAWASAALCKRWQTLTLVISMPHLIVWRDRHVLFCRV